ncbi:MAG: hypothetical protein U1D55_15575 [Phycisphaerae bacterium]
MQTWHSNSGIVRYWAKRLSVASLGLSTVVANAQQLQRVAVFTLDRGGAAEARAWSIVPAPTTAGEVAVGGEIFSGGVWNPVYWTGLGAPPLPVVTLGLGGRIETVIVNGPFSDLRGAGYVVNAAGDDVPAFWFTPANLTLLPTLAGGGRVHDLSFDANTGDFVMCGYTINGAGVQFGAYWQGNPAAGFVMVPMIPLAAGQNSDGNALTRAPGGALRIVGSAVDGAGNTRAVHWGVPAAWGAPIVLANAGGGVGGAAEASLIPLTVIAGSAPDAGGLEQPVTWNPATGVSTGLPLSAGFTEGRVDTVIELNGIVYLLGTATDAALPDYVFGWRVAGGAPQGIGDLNLRKTDATDPRLARVYDATANVFSNVNHIYLCGTAFDGTTNVISYVARDVTPGDLDADGKVDSSDLGALLSGFGLAAGATYAQGDIDGDGDVDSGDLGILLANWGIGT